MIRATRELAMFPLGSVLFPAMPLQLRVFEPRYVEMLSSLLAGTVREFGVVLIERGSEVGGGDMRFGVGTVARIVSVDVAEDSIHVLASGTTRFEVVRWLQDEPFPRAEVLELPAGEFDESTPSKLAEAEALVRGTLARASEFVELPWAADVNLSPDLGERIWQVAGIAPLSPMDQYALLRSTSADELLSRLVDDTRGAEIVLTAGWGPEGDDGGE